MIFSLLLALYIKQSVGMCTKQGKKNLNFEFYWIQLDVS